MMDVAVIVGWYGVGMFFYVGGGSLVLAGTGFLHEHPVKIPDMDIWINVGAAGSATAAGYDGGCGGGDANDNYVLDDERTASPGRVQPPL